MVRQAALTGSIWSKLRHFSSRAGHSSPINLAMRLLTWLGLGLIVVGCGDAAETPDPVDEVGQAPHLAGLKSQEQRRFLDGLREFMEVETAATGLGPLFNAASCSHCHIAGGVGGAGTFRVLRAVCRDGADEHSATAAGSLIHLSITRPDIMSPGVPWACEPTVTQRRTTSVLGTGLLEAVSDVDIEQTALAQPEAVRGRVAYIEDAITHQRRVGRLGWKAQHATLDAFAADAYRNELGITNQYFPTEIAPGGDAHLLTLMDPTPDPEASESGVGILADFMRFSEAPRAPDLTLPGYALFRQAGCETCHKESYQTAASDASMGGRPVVALTDLLLHDVGTGPDIVQGAATASELRTPPLWGLGDTPIFLHDGRASTVDEAIRAHQQQGLTARDAYVALTSTERASLIAFLLGR